jgi:hypothetical protein
MQQRGRCPEPDAGVWTPELCPYRLNNRLGWGHCVHGPSCPASVQHCHQRGKQLVVPANFTLLTLPAYSPELNPMGNVWDYLRQNKLCARVWDTYEDIVEACKCAWHFLIDHPERIRSLGGAAGPVSMFKRAGIRFTSA